MRIELHPSFKKSYKKRIANNPKLVAKTAERLKFFTKDPTNPILKDHPLKGSKIGFRAFSITGDIRVVYKPVSKDIIILLDIGTHNQVYQRN